MEPRKNALTWISPSVLGALFLAGLGLQAYAERMKDRGTVQVALIIQICLVIIAVVGFAVFHRKSEDAAKHKDASEWLLRLVIVTALGLCVVLLYSVQWVEDRALIIDGVGLLSAGALWLLGVLLGFIFGVPRRVKGKTSSLDFEPSTSLEEVADWLTKILVGMGLAELAKIPGKINGLASYIALGMGDGDSHKGIALAICLYFPACGFLFGFIWARIFLLDEFRRAGELLDSIYNKARGGSTPQMTPPPPRNAPEKPTEPPGAPVRQDS